MTRFTERPGTQRGLAVSDTHLYFTWRNDTGDIWVMDVVTDESE